MKFKVYDVLVLIGGELKEQVNRINQTAAEVYLLRDVHGLDAVRVLRSRKIDGSKMKPEIGNEDDLRAYLVQRYKEARVNSLFGGRMAALPKELNEAAEKEMGGLQEMREAATSGDAAKFAAAVEAEVQKRLEAMTAPVVDAEQPEDMDGDGEPEVLAAE